jgi:FixJ family two-component response regulator
MRTTQGTLFIVDDDAKSRKAAAALAASMRIRCETFASGEEFLHRYEQSLTGCVLLDYRLGGMDGLRVQERLLAMHSALCVVLISAYVDGALSLRALAGGAVAIVEKPYRNDDLADAVRRALDQSASQFGTGAIRNGTKEQANELSSRPVSGGRPSSA